MIKFICKNCGQRISMKEKDAGKKGRCPGCKNIISVPPVKQAASETDVFPDVGGKTFVRPEGEHTVSEDLEAPPETDGSSFAAEETKEEGKGKRLWFMDVFLYPTSWDGLVQMGIILFLGFLITILNRYLSLAAHYGTMIYLLLRVLLMGYLFYYLALCVADSAKGGTRAPDTFALDIPDVKSLVLKVFLMLGCLAICFFPATIYYILTGQRDFIFWIMAGIGGFFFPMALLAGLLFDALDALNPVLIAGSIIRAFWPYGGLILSFYALGGFFYALFSAVGRRPYMSFIAGGIILYMLFIEAHILGRFYRGNKDRLGWED